MLKKSLLIGAIAGIGVLMSGCATILDGKTQNINLTSSKPQTVDIDGKKYTTPTIVTLDKTGEDKMIKVDGCNKTILLKREVSPTFFVNILSGGAFGSTTDYATHAMWRYDQSNVNVDCQ